MSLILFYLQELFCFGCPTWDKLFAEIQNTSEGRAMLEPFGGLFDYVNNQTGQHLTDLLTLYYYYFGFEIQVCHSYQIY